MYLDVAIRSSTNRSVHLAHETRSTRRLIFLLMLKHPNACTKGTRSTPGWSMPDISCETSQTSRFSTPRPLLSSGKRNEGEVKRKDKQREREREREREWTVWLLPSDAWLGNSYNTTSLQEGFRFHPARRLEIYCSPVDCGFPDSPVCPYKWLLLIDRDAGQENSETEKMKWE